MTPDYLFERIKFKHSCNKILRNANYIEVTNTNKPCEYSYTMRFLMILKKLTNLILLLRINGL